MNFNCNIAEYGTLLTVDVDLDCSGHGSVGDGLVLGGAPELAEEVFAAELEPDLVAPGAGAVGLLEGARLACVLKSELKVHSVFLIRDSVKSRLVLVP